MHKKLDKVTELKNKLICCVENQMAMGEHNVDTKELGEVIDMIKDLAETEEKCWKACYYKSIYEAMQGYDENDRQGYANWRYSSGRFAPSGRGHYAPSGYSPAPGSIMMDNNLDRMFDQPGMVHSAKYGYPVGKHGRDYDEYEEYKRHYTETKSPEDKKKMDEHAKKHVEDSIETMKDILRNADPQLKSQMKQDLSRLINDLN